MEELSRRTFLKQTVLGGAALGLAGAGAGVPRPALAQAGELRWANLSPGFTILVTEYLTAKGIDKKLGLNLAKPVNYTAVSTYYNDFVAGNMDVCIGTWDTFAARYLANVPIQLVCNISTGEMINIVIPKEGPKSIKDLEGKVLAAPQSTGTYRMSRAVIKDVTGIDIESATRVQNVDNPAAAVTLVMANRADAALSWEPNISIGLSKMPSMRVLYNTGNEYRARTGHELPFFGVAIRKDIAGRPGLVEKIDKAFGDCLAGILANTDEAVDLAGSRSGFDPAVLKMAIKSGRLRFKHASMADEGGRKAVLVAADLLQRNGLLPRALDSGFFAG
jgi:NitT/TauT family transport system substrate-binding protein